MIVTIYSVALVLVYIQSLHVSYVVCWTEWKYATQYSLDPNSVTNANLTWRLNWQNSPPPLYQDDNTAPRPRRGHTLVNFKDNSGLLLPTATYGGKDMVIMFGGRDNNDKRSHIPKTYQVEKVDGVFKFTTYDQRPVNPCFDNGTGPGVYYSEIEKIKANCFANGATSSLIDIGIFYNDVWAYIMCDPKGPDQQRFGDSPCTESGWIILHPGANEGGCVNQLGILVCNVPSERYLHSAAIFDDGCMYVYGGYSQRCVDYCDDMWFFDVYIKGWREVYAAGKLGSLTGENIDIYFIKYTQAEVPIDSYGNSGPGKRWKSPITIGEVYETDKGFYQDFVFFGGHRLWHGFAIENSVANDWNNTKTYPFGGYLDDLWVYSKKIDYTTVPGSSFKTNEGRWLNLRVKSKTIDDPGLSYDTRSNKRTESIWPPSRSSHGIAYDAVRKGLWLYGGYHTYFPYLNTAGPGAGPGTSSDSAMAGLIPYPGYNYTLSDLWFYDFTTGYWTQIHYPDNEPSPGPRSEMIFLLIRGEILFVHGGYSNNLLYDDLWYYNITTGKWFEKKDFIYPMYPDECTDDLEYIKEESCVHLQYKKPLERDSNPPYDILKFQDQRGYWPYQPGDGDTSDSHAGDPYFPIFPKGSNLTEIIASLSASTLAEFGTPKFPNAATGPLQYAKPINVTFNGSDIYIYVSCTSVQAEVTRPFNDNPDYKAVFIPQTRRQKPGWDGCRSRQDRNDLLENALMYEKPLARSMHAAVYFNSTNEIIMYGGMAYDQSHDVRVDVTYNSFVRDDMWLYGFDNCINNCSLHGDCYYGICLCYPGSYGIDCSNTSCPGTSCHYDEYSHEQICYHACQAGYIHTDADTYVQDISKIPCTKDTESFHEVNGVCDGFGTAMCSPPYIGDDCSIKDCSRNCSFNGYCSVEYPVSRCLCEPGYYGEFCENTLCLNNCSYPNGICDITTGRCSCRMTFSPYNNTQPFHPWGGMDCSFIHPYSGTRSSYYTCNLPCVFAFVFLTIVYIINMYDNDNR